MRKKIMGILIIGLLVSTIFPVAIADTQPKLIEIQIKGGRGLRAIVKNHQTIDINDAKIQIFVDGFLISKGCRYRESTIDIKAGGSSYQIIPTFGFGSAYITIKVGAISQSVSGKLFGWFFFAVK